MEEKSDSKPLENYLSSSGKLWRIATDVKKETDAIDIKKSVDAVLEMTAES